MLYVPTGNGMMSGFMLKAIPVSVKPGEKTTVTLGGDGRPVIGKVTVPAGLEESLTNGRQRVTIHAALPPRPAFQPPELPAELKAELGKIQTEAEKIKDDPEKLEAFRKAWLESDAGKKLMAIFENHQKNAPSAQELKEWNDKNSAAMQYAMAAVIDKDGTFRVEDVPPGNWTLRVDLYDDEFKNLGASQPLDFSIPEMPGGRSNEPFDAGTIAVP